MQVGKALLKVPYLPFSGWSKMASLQGATEISTKDTSTTTYKGIAIDM